MMQGLFAAEFKCDRSQMRRGLFHDLPADSLAAGKKDIVKMFLEQTGVFCASAGNNGSQLQAQNILLLCSQMTVRRWRESRRLASG